MCCQFAANLLSEAPAREGNPVAGTSICIYQDIHVDICKHVQFVSAVRGLVCILTLSNLSLPLPL